MKTLSTLYCGCHAVGTDGLIYSRIVHAPTKKMGESWKRLATTLDKCGRPKFSLHGKTKNVLRVVAETFIANPKDYPCVRHKNGIPTDNRVENLEWGTVQMNMDDREKHNNTAKGEKTGAAKLSDNKVLHMRRLRKSGKFFYQIAKQFGVGRKTAERAIKGETWKHVCSPCPRTGL